MTRNILTVVLTTVFACLLFVAPANAKGHHHKRHHAPAQAQQDVDFLSLLFESSDDQPAPERRQKRTKRGHGPGKVIDADLGSRAGLGPRPGRWCGWYARKLFGGGPQYNLAWNWSKRGTPTSPVAGALVVWRHHVGVLVSRVRDNIWIVHSGNDGGRVRERARSVAGAVFRSL